MFAIFAIRYRQTCSWLSQPSSQKSKAIRESLAGLDGWELRDGRLRKQYTFRTFLRAIAFVNSVAYLAEGAGHHPDITINYNKVTLRLITHSAGALTDRDFSLATDIDAKLGSKLMIAPPRPKRAAGPDDYSHHAQPARTLVRTRACARQQNARGVGWAVSRSAACAAVPSVAPPLPQAQINMSLTAGVVNT